MNTLRLSGEYWRYVPLGFLELDLGKKAGLRCSLGRRMRLDIDDIHDICQTV